MVGKRLGEMLGNGRLHLHTDFFWTSPLPMWELPPHLRADLSRSHLVISKGDANYRRLLGDRHWPATTPFPDILSYFPAPILALRTPKSEIICGLDEGRAEETAVQDPDWLTNGKRGVIQFAP
jgi:hypothetical protein